MAALPQTVPTKLADRPGNFQRFAQTRLGRNLDLFVQKLGERSSMSTLVSVIVHVALVLVFGTAVLFVVEPPVHDFSSGDGGFVVSTEKSPEPPGSNESASALERVTQDFVPDVASTATTPPITAITSAAPSAFALTAVPSSTQMIGTSSIASGALAQAAGAAASSAARTAGGSGLGGASTVSFLGSKIQGRRFVFMLDYSGTMRAPGRRKLMESELEKTMASLPENTQIAVIAWAGPAWNYDQTAPEVKALWKTDGHAQFVPLDIAELTPPKWLKPTKKNQEDVMEGLRAQKHADGGTDWRNPFILASLLNPPPDAIFLLTDGQVFELDKWLKSIKATLSKLPKKPTVNTILIAADPKAAAGLQKLSDMFDGDFSEVKKQ
jgi:hypothetical protein